MNNFIKWVKDKFSTDLPNEYAQFLVSSDKNSIVGKRFRFYENENLTATDIHYFFGIGDNGTNSIEWNYNNYLSEGIIPRFFLPIAEDSGGNLICLNMDLKENHGIYFVPHDNYEMTYYFVANSFSEWYSKMYSEQIIQPECKNNIEIKLEEQNSSINPEVYNKVNSDDDVSEASNDDLASFIKDEKMNISELLCSFYRLNSGIEVNKKIEFVGKNKTKYSVSMRTVLSFGDVKRTYYELIGQEPILADYLPIAMSASVHFIPLLKVRKRNMGKVFFWNAFNRDIVEAYNSVENFFRALDIEIHSHDVY